MKRITSKGTIFYKRVFPVMWLGGLAAAAVLMLGSGKLKESDSVMPFLVAVVLLATMGYLIMKTQLWILIDEVHDEGASLLFRNADTAVRVNLADIESVSYKTIGVVVPRVTIRVKHETELGSKLRFMPTVRAIPFMKVAAINELVDRIRS
jgi:hypothetical protein